MKKIIALIISLTTMVTAAYADTCATGLMPAFTAQQAKEICATFSAGVIGTLANDTYAVARNAADSANINVWKVDSSDNTVINSSASDSTIFQLADDASRLITLSAASDAAISTTWGDGGTTATQIWTIAASTADSDDDSSLILCGGGGTASTRGSCITIPGEEVSGGSDITYNAGTSDTHIFNIAGTTALTVASGQATVVGDVSLSNNLVFTGTSKKIVAGPTSLLIRNAADSVSNVTIADGGTVTLGAAADLVHSVGLSTMALQEAVAGTACMGTLTANGATPVVTSTTCATTGSRIFLSRTSAETGVVTAWVSAISNGVSFSITGEAGDTGTYNWIIFHESP